MDISYWFRKVISKFKKNHKEYMCEYFRLKGVGVGRGCTICCNILSTEPYLISIGNNVTVSTNVKFVTHDSSIGTIFGKNNYSDVCGRIDIGDQVFIGMNSIIMYGVQIPHGTIIAAGSVVTRSVYEENTIIGGNPAKKIGDVQTYKQKVLPNVLSLHGLDADNKKKIILDNSEKLIKR